MNACARTLSVALPVLLFCSTGLAAPSKIAPQHRPPRFVDIAATVRDQVERSLAITEEPATPFQGSVVATAGASGERKVLMLGLAVLLSAISTFVILRNVAGSVVNGIAISPVSTRHPATPSERPFAERALTTRECAPPFVPGRVAGEAMGIEGPEHDDQTVRLLQSFHRGHGELSLAMRLGSDTRGNRTRAKLEQALPQVDGDDGRAHVARQFGVGKGEIDLAVHLKEFQTSQLRKEQV